MLQLDHEPVTSGSINEKPVKRLSHYHSPSFPAQQLKDSMRIPKRAVASHGWGLDGNVDDVFYAAALGYDESFAHDCKGKELEAYFAETGEIETMRVLFERLQTMKTYESNAEKLKRKGISLGRLNPKPTTNEAPDPKKFAENKTESTTGFVR